MKSQHRPNKIIGLCLLYLCISSSCNSPSDHTSKDKLFTVLPSSETGIDFQNKIVETEHSNYYQYMYTYIGGGVAAADFNNDGLEDLFFISNSFDNKLYINQGELKFKEIAKEAGIEKREGFDTGVAVVDINNDGWQDIYICRGGWVQDNNGFANMLYVNNGDLTFTERADEYGLADNNRSIAASFFDYDRDGDIDVYISNTPDFIDRAAEILDLQTIQNDPNTLTQKGSDKLYQNDGKGHFNDVSLAAGIMPDLGFGLNPQVGDLNGDGWLDIYVCNDFRIPDFVYINQRNGTFKEGRNEFFKHISFNSMGSDIADINNDGLFDVFTLDMNPADYVRSKTTMGMTPVDRFESMVEKGYHHNYMHNMLQVNNGNGTFREVANMAGVANTDWSWSSLLADFDLDGFNDVFVTNGVFRDVIDRDKNSEILEILRKNNRKPTKADFLAFTKMLPQQKLTNYFFKNKGDLSFKDVSYAWTDSVPSFSNGAVYADFDNDGDLDIAVNNINDEATILKNNAIQKEFGNYLAIKFEGPENNTKGIGAVAKMLMQDGSIQIRQVISTRGFLSSVPQISHFGISKNDSIAEIEIIWPDGRSQTIPQPDVNQSLVVKYKQATTRGTKEETKPEEGIFTQVSSNYAHIDPYFNDYQKQILLPHKLSQTGPAAATGDVNSDGLEDLFIGGGHTQSGQLFLGKRNGQFQEKSIPAFIRDKQREDVGASFLDVDGDQDLDLYVVSGSYEFAPNSRLLMDRVYINDGKGNFDKSPDALPQIASAGSVVVPADYDQDGDMDVFVGGRVVPGRYPLPAFSNLLVNDQGKFQVKTQELAEGLAEIGMVTDAVWKDMDMDQDLDLVITGEWMGIHIFENEQGTLKRSEDYPELDSTYGWWNSLLIEDFNSDGHLDIAAGNLGLNSKFHASHHEPFHVYTNDFDFNGTVDVFLAKYYEGVKVPVRGKTCSSMQLPHLANKITSFNEFASLDLGGILGPGIQSALHYKVNEFRSGIFYGDGKGSFSFHPFPLPAQESPINDMLYEDFDGDGLRDLLLAGNNYMPEIETTRSDAGIGVFLKGEKNKGFTYISHQKTKFFAHRDVRKLLPLKTSKTNLVLVLNNNDTHQLFRYSKDQ